MNWALAAVTALSVPAAMAERALDFAPLAVPRSGAAIVAVGEQRLEGPAAAIDRRLDGALRRAIDGARFEAERGQTLTLTGFGGFSRLGLVAVGNDVADRNGLRDFGGSAAQLAREWSDSKVVVAWSGDVEGIDDPTSQIAFGAALGQYRFSKFKTGEQPAPGGRLEFAAADPRSARAQFDAHWAPVAVAVRFARDLVSEPANELYPESFVDRTRAAFDGLDRVVIEALDVAAMQGRGMGALLGVGRGSSRPPRLLVVRYRGGPPDQAPLVFAGKGITFDSGGISLKKSTGMWKMKYDMAGAAAVTGALLALAGRRAPVNAVAVAALAENMPAADAQRPGDVVRTMSGKTVEIHSTDAEGRLVLADAVWYAQHEFAPQLLIDVATLTGSVSVALGDEYAGLFTRDDRVAERMFGAGLRSGDPLWRLPLDPSYPTDIESDIADIKNVSGHRLAGAGVGAQFIGEFVKPETKWAHLDIAGMAWREVDAPTMPKGPTGFGVRLLDQLVREHYEAP